MDVAVAPHVDHMLSRVGDALQLQLIVLKHLGSDNAVCYSLLGPVVLIVPQSTGANVGAKQLVAACLT